MDHRRIRLLLVWNLVIGALALFALVLTVFFGEETAFSSRGWSNLKYFTVLSNLLEGGVSLVLAVRLGSMLRTGRGAVGPALVRWKLTAAAAVSVTFLVVALFFGPWVGYGALYRNANLWYHLVIPLLAAAEFLFLDRFGPLPFRATLWAFLPELIYGLAYLANLLLRGVGEGRQTNDFYGFVHWGLPVGLGIFAAILLTGWGSAVLLRWGNRAWANRTARSEKERKTV